MSIDDCYRGYYFAECALDSPNAQVEPRFACSPDRADCAWFTGCVATGYVASDCPAEDLCCHDNRPFVEAPIPFGVDPFITPLGTLPWTRGQHHNLAVTLGPVPVEVPLECVGPEPITNEPSQGQTVCGMSLPFKMTVRDTVTFVVNLTNRLPWMPFIEVDPVAMTARVCAYRSFDVYDNSCPPAWHRDPICANSGTVRLSRMPTGDADLSGLILEFQASFPGGTELHGTARPFPLGGF
ncbi:MAG: hypothetical protein KBG28_01050 [Kofleriaceae bacterium]|nr:hypothetical protein [Kofleriaceae bacterium]